MNFKTLIESRSTGYFIALAWMAALLPAPSDLFAQGAPATPQTTPTALVDAMNGLFGKQTYGRAIHAKGIVLEGTFTPSSSAASITSAKNLGTANGSVPVFVRFSSFAGIPSISDNDDLAQPRGMAIKFRMRDGSETDIVSHSYNGFPTATAGEFEELLRALARSGSGTPAPTPADQFLATHPIAKTFLTTQGLPPASFATINYYGVNSFRFTNAKGESTFGRYQIVPAAAEQLLTKEQATAASKDYLEQEIAKRLASGQPARFTLQVQLAEAGDRIDDPSIAWPASRRVVKLGEIVASRVLADSDTEERKLMFTPTAVVDGIEPADPMIAMRGAAYGVSYGRRHPQP
jgi:catalase